MNKSYRIGNYETRPYSKFRKDIEIVTSEGWRKRSAHAILEIDVTVAREKIKKIKGKTGEKLSFTGFIINCVSESMTKHKSLNSYKLGRKKIVSFDDVDVAIPVEKKTDEEVRPRVYIVRKANEKTVSEITKEIRSVQKQSVENKTELLGEEETKLERFVLSLPFFLKKILMRFIRKKGLFKKKYMGSTAVTAIGMKGNFKGWIVPLGGTATTLFVVGGISKKPRVVDDKIVPREILHLTITVDHDLVDGGPLARFVETLTNLMEKGYGLE